VKILLHMGLVKTGTTALQRALHEARDALRRHGVLYPHFGGADFAHHLLLPVVEDPGRLPAGQLRDFGGPEAAVERAWDAWNSTCAAVAADPPRLLVLSSEFLIHHTGARAKARLAALLSELAAEVTPILYIRHPVDHFRARLQEWLKVESRPLPAPPDSLQQAITDCETAFGRATELLAFDRACLAKGDITTDFSARFLAGMVPPGTLRPREENPGLSAEALVLLVRLRARGGATARLIRPLALLDQSDPPGQALALYPEVASATLRAATSFLWLAETGRLTLPGLDLAAIDGTPLPDWLRNAAPETLFPHDPARLRRLEDQLHLRHPELLPQ
jgi:hypothetical protein